MLFAAVSFAADEDAFNFKSGLSIVVDGDMVEYFQEEGKIVAEGNVVITYGDVQLNCDKIEVNTKTRQALCEGNVRIEQAEGVLTGDLIRYDFIKEKGEILGADVKAYPWFGTAEETKRISKTEFVLRNGRITTCDLDVPHYRLEAKEIKVFPGEKVVAKNVIMYIGKVPVMWFPYYYHPIIDMKAKVQFIPGSSSDWGYFLLSAWRMYLKGKTKVDVLIDYREKKGFAEGADLYYYLSDFGMEGLGDGLLRTYFIHQNDIGTYDPQDYRGEGTDAVLRKRIQWKHRIDFEPGTMGMLEFNKLSDEHILKDYFYNEYEEENVVPPNYVYFVSAKENYTFSVNTNARFNNFYTVAQKLPEVKIEIPNQRMWESPFYYSGEWSGTLFTKVYASDEIATSEKVKRLDSLHKLSYVTGVGPLTIVPYGTFRETLYSRKGVVDNNVGRTIFGGGVDVSSRFHKIYDVETDFMGLDINQIRHIIVPKAGYSHLSEPTVDWKELYHMDEIDDIDKENKISFSLENKLQTKRHTSEGTLKTVDLVRFITSVDYLFRLEREAFDLKDETLREFKFDLEISPYDWLFVDSELEISPKNQAVKMGSVEASIRPDDFFQIDMGYRYEKMIPDPRNQFTFDMLYRFTPKWGIGLYERFDFHSGEFEEQRISLIRDLHCWEVELSYSVEGSNFVEDDFTIWLAFRVKAFPDLQIGLDRSFEKRPPGSINR